jgi:predicted RNase H-like nuclease (RuvC/YqgF family)
MLFAEDLPPWLPYLLGPGGLVIGGAVVWLVGEIRKSTAAYRDNQEKDSAKQRANKIEDESRAITHMQNAIDTLRADNKDLRQQVVDLKSEMRDMQKEARRTADVATQNQMRADRFHMYCLYLEGLLQDNKVVFRRWNEDDEPGTHPAIPSPGVSQ